jgi:hypothetical protein
MADLMQPGFRTVEGVQVRYAETTGRAEPSILLTSPWPESVYAFAPIWSSLAQIARLVAVDLPGFGGSERRNDLLSPSAMGEFLARLAAEWGLASYVHRFRTIDPRVIVCAALEPIEGYRPPPEVREDYLGSYAGDRFAGSMCYARADPDELPRLADELPRLAERLPEIDTPVADEYASVIADWFASGYCEAGHASHPLP